MSKEIVKLMEPRLGEKDIRGIKRYIKGIRQKIRLLKKKYLLGK